MNAFRATLLVLGLSMVVTCALFFVLCDRYRYYDYHPAGFSQGQIMIQVNLRGNYSKSAPTERGKPYDLVIRVSSPQSHDVSIGNVWLRSKSTRLQLKTNEAKKHLIQQANGPPIVVYLFENIDVPYADYVVEGLMDPGNGASRAGEWRVDLKTDYSAEWRVRFIDMLMSV